MIKPKYPKTVIGSKVIFRGCVGEIVYLGAHTFKPYFLYKTGGNVISCDWSQIELA